MPSAFKSNEARHTDEIQDIISSVPGWLLRWGISLFFLLLILLAVLASFIHYPDFIHTRLTIVEQKNQIFYGEIDLLQNNLDKIKIGQRVLIKLDSYPFEEFGVLGGKISNISNVPNKNHLFLAKVDIKTENLPKSKKAIRLQLGILGDADVLTEDATIMQRISKNFFKTFWDH